MLYYGNLTCVWSFFALSKQNMFKLKTGDISCRCTVLHEIHDFVPDLGYNTCQQNQGVLQAIRNQYLFTKMINFIQHLHVLLCFVFFLKQYALNVQYIIKSKVELKQICFFLIGEIHQLARVLLFEELVID